MIHGRKLHRAECVLSYSIVLDTENDHFACAHSMKLPKRCISPLKFEFELGAVFPATEAVDGGLPGAEALCCPWLPVMPVCLKCNK
jgi:hypothetical protein